MSEHENETQQDDAAARRAEMLRRFLGPQEDETAELKRWVAMTMDERGEAMMSLLRLVDAIGNFPEKREMFPGFPKPHERNKVT